MYNLEFDDAHRIFQEWERAHPSDAMGPVSDAAAYLFGEFERLHILQSEFFNTTRVSRTRRESHLAERRAEPVRGCARNRPGLASRALSRDPNDVNARFRGDSSNGLHADYLALINKSYLTRSTK